MCKLIKNIIKKLKKIFHIHKWEVCLTVLTTEPPQYLIKGECLVCGETKSSISEGCREHV
jgi:hypothetical protein